MNGFVVSDRFHELLGSLLELDERAAYPSAVLPVARGAFSQPVETGSPEGSAGLRDRLYSRTMRDLRAEWPVQFAALRYQGLDTVGHYYLRYTQTRGVGDLPEDERRRQLQVLDRYYAYIDGEIGEAIGALAQGDLLLVVSGFGMQPLNPWKHWMGRLIGDPMNGTHERAPDGFLLAYGTAVEPGRPKRGSIVDVTPTVLYFLGLPVGRDMDGYARADLFKRAFTTERPVAFVPTYSR